MIVPVVRILGLRNILCLAFAFLAGVTPSGAQTEEVLTFAAVGDYGDAGTDAATVAAQVLARTPALVITVGDNNYNNSSSTATWDQVVGRDYHSMIRYPSGSASSFRPGTASNAFFPALGNHDWDAGGQTEYFELPGNERYYTFGQGPVQFFCIDSDPREPDGTTATSPQALWLQAQLAASHASWKVVYMHHPPYSSCVTHGSTPWMQWPFEQWGADVVVGGHDHVYERIMRDDNADGDSTVYLTVGTGGHALYPFGTPVAGSRVRYNSTYGWLLAEATGSSLSLKFFSTTGGGTLIDQYTLHSPLALAAGDVIIAGFQSWNTVGSQNPAEFVTLFNTTDSTISLETMNLIVRLDPDGAGGSGVGIRWQLSAEPVSLAGKTIAPHSFFLIAESGVASPGGVKDVLTNMDLPTGEGGSTERAIGIELVIGGQHMDYVVYGRNTGSDGDWPVGDIPFDGITYPRPEVIRNTLGAANFEEGLVSRDTPQALYAGYAATGAYADDVPAGIWTSPHSTSYSSYQARNSLSPAVPPPAPEYTLTLTVAGVGTVTKNPDKTTYTSGETVQLTAHAPVGWAFSSWSGDLTGSTNPATLTMSANRSVTATFVMIPFTGFVEPFENTAYVVGTMVGVHPDWFDGGGGPTITASGGVAGSKGLSDATNIFIWKAHPFAWSSPTLHRTVFQMDFKTDASANFDDDRIGWMTTASNVTSSNFFGVQLDPGGSGYNIETYWQNSANADVRTSLANLTGMAANTWYRFRLEVTKLGATDAGLEMALIRLDSTGTPVGTPITASVPSTAALGADAPNTRYFTAASLWPAFKNFTTSPGPADNACFEAVPVRYALAVTVAGNGTVTKNPDKTLYDAGEIVQLTAVPVTGNTFVQWTGDLSGSTNPASLTMDADKTVTATFAVTMYTITASAGIHGSISPSGAVAVAHGTNQAFTITPDPGYLIASVVVDGSPVSAVSPYVFTNVTAGHTIAATFVSGLESLSCTATGTPYSFPISGMQITFAVLPPGGGTVSVCRYGAAPPSPAFPGPPAGSSFVPLWFDITSTLPNNWFQATIIADVSGVPGFGAGTRGIYYNATTGRWVLVSGTYNGVAHTVTFTTTHCTAFAFINPPGAVHDVFVSASTAPAAAVVRPGATWAGGYPGRTEDWGFTGTQPLSFYLVPQAGTQLGACELIAEWDSAVVSLDTVVFTGSIFSGPNLLFAGSNRSVSGNAVTLNASLISPNNVTTVAGDYIARLDMRVKRPGHSAVALIGDRVRAFNVGSDPSAVYVTPHQAEISAYLGDVASAGTGAAADGSINFEDLVPWSLAYWSGLPPYGMTKYKAKYDIGPTLNGSVFSRPLYDLKIDFEDLMIFSIGYGQSLGHELPKARPQGDPLIVSLGTPVQSGQELSIPVLIGGGITDLRGISLELRGSFGSFCGAEKGELLRSLSAPVLIFDRSEEGMAAVDCAIPGLETGGLHAGGELLVLRFAGMTSVRLTRADSRTSANEPIDVALDRRRAGTLPTAFALGQNYPNPFNPATTITFAVPTMPGNGTHDVSLEVYDMLGRLVATLATGPREAGVYEATFDAANLSSGTYIYRLRAGSYTGVRKMLLLK